MKKKTTIIALIGLILVLLTGVFLVVFLSATAKKSEETAVTEKDVTMFSAYTDVDVYKDVPAMVTKSGKFEDAKDYGNKNYVININGTTVEEYKAYLNTLETAGFKKHSDNGEDAMEGYVYEAAYTKNHITLVVSHAIKQEHTYIAASYDLPLSDHLIYNEEDVKEIDANAKTKVHMLQLNENGNSFVIQLKNGHFLIHDGGTKNDAPYLLDYLEELTPGNEKPVVEAWFISHAHGDHTGAMIEIAKDMNQVNRIYVEGFYFTEPSAEVLSLLTMGDGTENNWYTTRSYKVFKNQEGKAPNMYRMQLGQRYYFCDLKIDITLTLEQFPVESYYSNDFNDTSTWMMHHIEGQRFLHAGDTHHTGMRIATYMFDESYFDLDVMAVFHHGINVWDYWTDFCTLKTVLYTSFRTASIWEPSRAELARVEENEHLRQSCEEYLSHGEGTVVLTFPYKVGSAEIMESSDWRYNNGKPIRDVWK